MSSPYLLLLYGPSGVGKSSVKGYLESELGFESAPKYTTRAHRGTPEDDRDFVFVGIDDFPQRDILRFDSYGAAFGIQLSRIADSLQRGRGHVLTVGDQETVRELERLFPHRVATMMIYCKKESLRSRVLDNDMSGRANRWARIERELEDIYSILGCIRYVVDNSGSLAQTQRQLDELAALLNHKFHTA